MVAAKSLPMVTRAQLKERLRRRGEDVALVGVDAFGAENFGTGGIHLQVPRTVGEAIAGPESQYWRQAIDEEMEAMEEAEVWGPPEYVGEGVNVTPLRFVFAKKVGPDGRVARFKARLIFQNRGDSDDADEDFYAPVVDKQSLRIFLAVVAGNGWYLEQSDIKTAFLNAENTGRITCGCQSVW